MQSMEALFVLALVLYTLVIFAHKFKKELVLWMIVVFGIALTIDTVATIIVCVGVSPIWTFNLHAITGFASLIIMALHFIWAVCAFTVHSRFMAHFNKYSLYAWFIWLIAFISGIPMK